MTTVIIGAGITGISCAHYLKTQYVVLEKENTAGGLCRSIKSKGFTFDYSGHFIHLRNEDIKKLIFEVLKNKALKIERNAWIYEFNRYIPFPFQANLYCLPDKIKHECLKTFLDKKPLSSVKYPLSFLKWSNATFGKGITKHFMQPYNEKLWTVSADKLTADWAAPFVPVPDTNEIKFGALNPNKKKYGYNSFFYYPETGGCQSLINGLIKKIDEVQYNTEALEIDAENKTVLLSNGKKLKYKNLVSTQPLTELLDKIKNLPWQIKTLKNTLKCNSVLCINIGVRNSQINKKPVNNAHWIYFPENKYPFYRVGIYSNIIESSAPKNSCSFYVEISYDRNKILNKELVTKKTINHLAMLGLISRNSQVTTVNYADIPNAYVIYDKYRQNALNQIHSFLNKNNIFSIGRYGAWKYSFIEESISDAKKTAEIINQL